MYNRPTTQLIAGAASLTGRATALVLTAAVMLAAATVFGLQRVSIQKIVMTGRRQNHTGLVSTRETLWNQVLRTVGLLS